MKRVDNLDMLPLDNPSQSPAGVLSRSTTTGATPQPRAPSDQASTFPAPIPEPPLIQLRALVEAALAEDLGRGDVTTESLVPADLHADARVIARVDGVVAGLNVARLAFELTEPRVQVELLAGDGAQVHSGQELARITGPARGILSAERVALNFLQRLSGTATLAARYVTAVEGTGARIVDTRKTTPGLRLLEKYAVRCGGASNHR
jgi:nicotinate-nucleotide pyrophosphorylase (carboxylating)